MNLQKIPTTYFLLIAIILSAIKFYKIDTASIWLDEAHSIFQAHKSLNDIINNSAQDQNPPLYFILLKLWTNLLGSSLAAVRSFSALVNAFTAILIFYFSKKHINLTTAIFASLAFIFSDIQLYYAQEARVFSLLGLLCIVSFILFENMKEKSQFDWINIISLGTVYALMIYAHYISVFAIAVQLAITAIFHKDYSDRTRKVIISCTVAFLLFLPWLGKVFTNIPEAGSFWLSKPNFGNLKGIFISFAGNKVITVIYMLLIAAGAFLTLKKAKEKDNMNYIFVLLILWLLLPILTTYFVAHFTPVFLIRYLLYSSIGLYLLIGFTISSLPVRNLYKGLLITAIIILSVGSIKIAASKGENWILAVEKVKELKKAEDDVILSAYYTNTAFSYYYYGYEHVDYTNAPSQLTNDKIHCIDRFDNDLLNKLKLSNKVIAVQSHQIDADPENTVIKTISEEYSLTETFEFEKVKVSIFEKRIINRVYIE